MTKEIQLTHGQMTTVDDEDYDYLIQWKWCARHAYNDKFYVVRHTYPNGIQKRIHLHRELALRMGLDLSADIDHKDRNPLNNTRANLRAASQAGTARNASLRKDNKSGFKGVYHKKQIDKWEAYIRINGKRKHLGYFESPFIAAAIYNRAARELYGEFAALNVIPNPQPHE